MTPGIETLNWLHDEQLQIDEKWSVRDERGFTWWAGRFAQRIEVVDTKPMEGGGELALVRVKTEVISGFELDVEALLRVNALALPFASLASFVHDREAGTLGLASSAWVHKNIREWINPILSTTAAIQLHEAELYAEALAPVLNAKPHHSAHPESGVREVPDEIAGVVDRLVLPMGAGPSLWEDGELALACDQYIQTPPCLLANAGGPGFTAEFPWGEISSLLQASSNEPHPRYGSGLLLRQRFPFAADDEADLVRVALNLNQADVADGSAGAYGFGSYCVEGGDLVFVAFYPNAIHRPGLIPNLYFTCAARARFISTIFLEDDWSDTWDEEGNCRAKSSVERMIEHFR